jgi:nucleoside triphosphate pyrophosphatase
VEFRVVPSDLDEILGSGPLSAAAARLALEKARTVAGRVGEGIVVGADTIVVIDGEALGKPSGPEDARAMLRRLRGREHEVVTGIAVVDARSGRCESTAVASRVRMAEYDESEIDAYVVTGEPLDKAGAYAIQGRGAGLIDRIDGSFTNVIGLPLVEVGRALEEAGLLAR